MDMAERELSAFMGAVEELYGPREAAISAGEWIDELESMQEPVAATARDLRLITIAASARLANRRMVYDVCHPPPSAR